MKFFYIPNCYSTQIEGTGLSFRFGYTVFGIAPPTKFWHRRTIDLPIWYRLFFGWHFAFAHYIGQSDKWHIFKFELGALQIWWETKGERQDEYTGFHIAFRGLKELRLLC